MKALEYTFWERVKAVIELLLMLLLCVIVACSLAIERNVELFYFWIGAASMGLLMIIIKFILP